MLSKLTTPALGAAVNSLQR